MKYLNCLVEGVISAYQFFRYKVLNGLFVYVHSGKIDSYRHVMHRRPLPFYPQLRP